MILAVIAVPPLAVDSALGAYRDEDRRLAAAVTEIEAVECALRGEPLSNRPAARSREERRMNKHDL